MEPIKVEISKDPRRIDLEGPILVAHQPEFLPWLGNISKAAMGDVYFIFDNAQYVKKHWQNKNRIRVKDKNGFHWLTIPVLEASNHFIPTNEVRMMGGQWRNQHLKALELSYKKSPYFKEIFTDLHKLYAFQGELLIDFLLEFINFAFYKFKVNIPVFRTSKLIEMGYIVEGKKSDLVINMCKIVNAKSFVFGCDGRTYIDKDVFIKNGIKFVFQDYEHPEYKQIHGEFISHMSFLDLLFNYGPNAIDILGKSNYLGE